MKDYQTEQLWQLLKKNPSGYDYLIDRHYDEHGLMALKELEIYMMSDKEWNFYNNELYNYLEFKMARVEQDEQNVREQRILDIKHKKRQIFWFYPTLLFAILGAITSVFSNWNNLVKMEKQKESLEKMKVELDKIKKSPAEGAPHFLQNKKAK